MTYKKEKYSFIDTYIKGEMLLGGWGVVGHALGAFNVFLIISSLDIFKYGVYLLVLAFYALVSALPFKILMNVILNDVIRFEKEGEVEKAKKLYLEMFVTRAVFSAVLFVSVFIGSEIIATFYDQDLSYLFKILSFLFIFDALYSSMRMLFQVRLKFGLTAFRPIVYKFIKAGFLLSFGVFAVLGVKEALISHIVATGLVTILFVPFFIRLYSPWRNIKAYPKSVLLEVIKGHGKWDAISQTFSQSLTNVRPWLIKIFVNTEAVAVFSVAESLYGALKILFPTDTLASLIPREIANKERSNKLLLLATKYLTMLGIFVALSGAFVMPLVIRLLFPEYEASIPLFYILLLALPFLSFRVMGQTFLVALRKQKYLLFVNTIKTLIMSVLPIILLSTLGIVGIAIERVLMSIIVSALLFGYFVNLDSMPWRYLFILEKEDKEFVKNFVLQIKANFKNILSR